MPVKNHIFRAYDIRGIVDVDFNLEWVLRLGKALGTYFLQCGKNSAVVGFDCRSSSPSFNQAMLKGLTDSGVDVMSIGMVATPVLYFAIKHLDKAAGVMITASHNPSQYNGFKIWSGSSTIYGPEIQKVHSIFENNVFTSGNGLVCEHDIMPAYIEAITSRTSLAKPVKVVVDGGNGIGGPALLSVLNCLGANVIPIYCEPDGNFPNHHPDPTVEANMGDLMSRVIAEKADLGIGLDGDADRIGVVDAAGRLLNGDELLSIYANELLLRKPGSQIIADVKCSDRLFADIRKHGGDPIMWTTGHSVIKAKMQELNAPLAGELSGHMFFEDQWYGFDDAIYAAARLLDILSRSEKKLTMLPEWPTAFSTREIQIACPDEYKEQVVSKAKSILKIKHNTVDIDGARVCFVNGWGLVRASNTQPVLVLRFEADSQSNLAMIRDEMENVIKKCIAEIVCKN